MEYKKEFKVSDWTDVKPTEKSHKEILEWANERRPYSPSDLINVFRTKGLFPRLDYMTLRIL
jgi:hypothetical protein